MGPSETAMTAPQKFLFETHFDNHKSTETSEVELAEVREQSYEEGRRAGEEAMRKSIDADIAAALEALCKGAQAAHDNFAQTTREIENRTVQLAIAAANKLAGELIACEPTASLEALFQDTIANLRSEPHVALHVPDSLVSEVEPRVLGIADAHGFEGKLVVSGDSNMEHGDCRIEWADGGASKSIEDVRQAVSDAIECYLASRQGIFQDLDLALLEEPAEIRSASHAEPTPTMPIETHIEHESGHAPISSGERL